MKGNKRTRGENASAEGNAPGPSKRKTRSASQQGQQAAVDQRHDTAASPAKNNNADAQPTPSLPLLPARAPQSDEISTQLARALEKHLQAAEHGRFINQMRLDDQLAEYAYRRGLLVTFIVDRPSATSSRLQIEAPEFASVDYLKRRITKAKLFANEFPHPDRFTLIRKPSPPVASPGGTVVPSSAPDLAMPEESSPGNPSLLFNLGFYAGETYRVKMRAAPERNDIEQQRAMLQNAARGDTRSPQHVPANPELQKLQQLLNGGPVDGQGQDQATAKVRPVARLPTASSPLRAQIAANIEVTNPAVAVAGAGAGPSTAPQELFHIAPRNGRAGKWSPDEIEALVTGVQAYGAQWALILNTYLDNPIDSRRIPLDLKDKWRNLVMICRDPTKAARSVVLTEELQVTILRLEASMR